MLLPNRANQDLIDIFLLYIYICVDIIYSDVFAKNLGNATRIIGGMPDAQFAKYFLSIIC